MAYSVVKKIAGTRNIHPGRFIVGALFVLVFAGIVWYASTAPAETVAVIKTYEPGDLKNLKPDDAVEQDAQVIVGTFTFRWLLNNGNPCSADWAIIQGGKRLHFEHTQFPDWDPLCTKTKAKVLAILARAAEVGATAQGAKVIGEAIR